MTWLSVGVYEPVYLDAAGGWTSVYGGRWGSETILMLDWRMVFFLLPDGGIYVAVVRANFEESTIRLGN